MQTFLRKVIRVKAGDSPNVAFALAQVANGERPTGEVLIPGVLSWDEYQMRRRIWDEHQQCVGLDAEWYAGVDEFMFPSSWLDKAEKRAEELRNKGLRRIADAMGVDSAMGGDNTAWAVIDRYGLLWLEARKTKDTTEVNKVTLRLMQTWNVPPEKIMHDAGGGGQVHADYLRHEGYPVRVVGFGEPVKQEVRGGMTPLHHRKELRENQYVYKNRRAQMYGLTRQMLNPDLGKGFGLPAEMLNRPRKDGGPSLRGQLSKIPIWYDGEGRMYLPPKQAKPDARNKEDRDTLIKRIGCSPDEAEALILAVYGLMEKRVQTYAGAI